ncbi:MAG: AAA family ATPase [Verrucomicrobia bacterium]|nr:AAA family ATPase [Verrucomicrobiota bacterium]
MQKFIEAVQAAGLTPPECIKIDGNIQRFSSNGNRHDKAGYYCLFNNGNDFIGGFFGCWRSDVYQIWTNQSEAELNNRDLWLENRLKIEASKREIELARKEKASNAAKKAMEIWEQAKSATDDHPYLKKKGVKSYGLKVDERGNLLIPVFDLKKEIHSLQLISTNTEQNKHFLPDGIVRGHCYWISGKENTIYLAEGYATAASIHQATGATVYISFMAGNLLPIAQVLKISKPDSRLVIAADNDAFTDQNPGLTKAKEAACVVGATFICPEFDPKYHEKRPTDFNDMHLLHGLEALKFRLNEFLQERAKNHKEYPRLRTGAEIRNLDIKIEWLIEGIIPKGAVSLLFGRGGIGKTTLALQICDAISSGGSFLGIPAEKTPVIYVDYENSLAILVDRLKKVGGEQILFWTTDDSPAQLDKDPQAYVNLLKNHSNALLIFDTLRSAQTGDENESRSMALVMQTLRQLRDQGATIILLHHTRKGSDSTYKGSTAIFDLVDHVMGLYPVKGRENDQEVDEDHMENTDRAFRFGTKDKTRFQPFKHFLRFDKKTHLFVSADDPGNFLLEQIQKLIPQEGIIQKDLLPILDRSLNIKQRRALALLQQGAGHYWSADKKPHLKNSIVYKAFCSFADPIGNVKLQNTPIKEGENDESTLSK